MATMTSAASPTTAAQSRLPRHTTAGVIATAVALGFALVLGRMWPAAAIYWIVGLAFGFVLQRSRFCFTAAFRDLFLLGDGRMLRGVLAGLGVATVGFVFVMYNYIPRLAPERLPAFAGISPVGPTTLVAGLIFGFGMVIAGGCMSGNLYRIGEGYVASVVALLGMLGGLIVMMLTWNWWYEVLIARQPIVWLPHTLGWTGAVVLTLLGLLGVYALLVWWEQRADMLVPTFPAGPELPPASVREHWAGVRRRVFVTGWPAVGGGVALGVIGMLSYLYERPVGVTGELGRWSHGLFEAVGGWHVELAGADLGPCMTVVAGVFATKELYMVLGLVAGSFVAALLAGEFKIRVPRQGRRYVQTLGGGVLMGYGAGLGIGCTLGAFFAGIPSLSLSGWVFGLGLLGGAWAGVKAIRRIG